MAVYTHLNHDDIAAFLEPYALGELVSFKGITEGVSNTNYFVILEKDEEQTRYVLTLFENHYKLEELPYFVSLMEWFAQRGIDCPKPLKTTDGRALCALKERPAILVSFLEGEGVSRIQQEHMAQLGTHVARMHVAGQEFPYARSNSLSVSGWEKLVDAVAQQADTISPGLSALINEEFNYLSEHWPQELPRGPIHADLFPDNVFFIKNFGKSPVFSGVIDFYFACNDFWAYDLAICVNAWCFDDRCRFIPERVLALMTAYNAERPLTNEEEAAFPLLLRGAALRFLLTRTYDALNPQSGADITPKDPLDYVARLEFFRESRL